MFHNSQKSRLFILFSCVSFIFLMTILCVSIYGLSKVSQFHTADRNQDKKIDFSELSRVIQFYNFKFYHCDPQGEDGYNPGSGDQTCEPHDSDYEPTSPWRISLIELLRLIQFYNLCGYEESSTPTEDGYKPVLCSANEGENEGIREGEGATEGEYIFKKFSGVNLPWINYGWDLGENPYNPEQHGGFSSNIEILNQDFQFLKDHGINQVRVFLFCDGRAGIIQEGMNFRFDERVISDMDALVSVAQTFRVQLIPVLLDYLIANGVNDAKNGALGEHPDWLTTYRQGLITLLSDFVSTYAHSQTITAWDLMNEPEFTFLNKGGVLTQSEVTTFLQELISAIRIKSGDSVKITLGSAQRDYMIEYWRDLGLDMYQFHYYAKMEVGMPLDFPVESLLLDRPVIIGEVEPLDVYSQLGIIEQNGYMGALFWSLRKVDEYDFASKANSYKDYFNRSGKNR
ncbi:MAG TPA: cellulase family glycosylhydrolase [Candidatus Hydrogenedens sp.]|nr:cellulase family glycosylhydrolase [Candidatus Hydrogenedens sp.]HPP60094.1 cellulase family glycosylhydrolase [Candidatus Hydrogenedens sp.]